LFSVNKIFKKFSSCLLLAKNKQIFPGLSSIRLHQEQAESKTKRSTESTAAFHRRFAVVEPPSVAYGSQGIDGRLFAADLPPFCRQFTAVWPPFGRAVVLLKFCPLLPARNNQVLPSLPLIRLHQE
jgi:hypothetical protein